MLDRSEVCKRGYLNEDYRLVHLKDSRAQQLDYHYHEFDKLVLQLSGRVTYHIEGRQYPLQPMDILLVSRNLIHLPEIDASQPYERIILWVKREFLARYSQENAELATCFHLADERALHLFRPKGEERSRYREMFEHIKSAGTQQDFGASLLTDTYVLQLMVALNRDFPRSAQQEDITYRFDPKMEEVTHYIRGHLAEELSIDHLAGVFYLSRYYLMHRFKEVYGCSVHQYIRQKRLQQAAEAIRLGVPILKASLDAGFSDYSVFLRAFRSAYGCSPRDWK